MSEEFKKIALISVVAAGMTAIATAIAMPRYKEFIPAIPFVLVAPTLVGAYAMEKLKDS